MAAEFNTFPLDSEIKKAMGVGETEVSIQSIDWEKVKKIFKKFSQWLMAETKKLMVWVGEILHEHRTEIWIALKDVAMETVSEAISNPDWATMTSSERRDLVYNLLSAKIVDAGIELGGHIVSEEVGIPPELEDEIRLVIEFALAYTRDSSS